MCRKVTSDSPSPTQPHPYHTLALQAVAMQVLVALQDAALQIARALQVARVLRVPGAPKEVMWFYGRWGRLLQETSIDQQPRDVVVVSCKVIAWKSCGNRVVHMEES